MKKTYKIQATRKTLIRWGAKEVGIKNAKRMINEGSILRILGASQDSTFKSKRLAEQVARRIEMMAAFVAGKLNKNDFESVRVIEA